MKKLILTLLLISSVAHADKFRTDESTFGKPGSSADKKLILDINQGANNPDIRSNVTDQDVQVRANTVRVGKPTVGNKQLDFNIGSGATNPKIRYNSGSAKIEFSNNGTDYKAIGSGSGGGSGITVLGDVNADFESGSGSWTASSGSFTIATSGSNLLFETRSGVFNSSASGQTLSNTAINTSAWEGLKGNAASASCYFKTAATDYKIQVYNGSLVLSERLIPASSTAVKVATPFQFPSSGTIQLRVISQSDAADIAVDNCFMGSSEGVQLSQAQYLGGITYPRVLNCNWTFAGGGTYSGFPADSDCTGAVTRGKASAPATLIPAVKFDSMPAGTYVFKVNGGLRLNNGATGVVGWRMSDGTNHSTKTTQTQSGTANEGALQEFVVHLANAQSNATFEIQAVGSAQTPEINNDNASADANYPDFVIDVFHYPSSGQQAYTFDTVANSWSGAHGSDCYFPTTSTSFVNPTMDASCTFTQRTNMNFGTVTSYNDGTPGNNLPGIVFTPSRAGTYRVCANPVIAHNTTGEVVVAELSDLTPTVIAQAQQRNSNSVSVTQQLQSSPLCGHYVASSVSPVTLRIRLLSTTGAGTASIDGNSASDAVTWDIHQIDQQVPAPVIAGGVLSSSTGVEKVERVLVSTKCTSTPCTITSQSGGTASVTRQGAGAYTLNFSAGVFSGRPSCVYSANDPGASTCNANTDENLSQSSTEVRFQSNCDATLSSLEDSAFSIVCMGPK
jgi:hypothetical protein